MPALFPADLFLLPEELAGLSLLLLLLSAELKLELLLLGAKLLSLNT